MTSYQRVPKKDKPCHRMPQSNDDEEQEKAFVDYLEGYIKFKKASPFPSGNVG